MEAPTNVTFAVLFFTGEVAQDIVALLISTNPLAPRPNMEVLQLEAGPVHFRGPNFIRVPCRRTCSAVPATGIRRMCSELRTGQFVTLENLSHKRARANYPDQGSVIFSDLIFSGFRVLHS